MGIRLVIIGAGGRMGRRILAMAVESGQFDIIGAVERPGHPDIGKDAGLGAGVKPIKVMLSEAYPAGPADVAIDFSQPEAVDQTISYCIENSAALVCGITGLNDRQKEQIKAASAKIPAIYATNMSVGMNVLFGLVGKVAHLLGADYDIEIVEQHHRLKKDSPSGSALTLAENICKSMDFDFPEALVHGRSGKDTLRQKGTIGMHAVRAGDITGIHSVIFGTPGETITLNHTANSRDTFVAGALRAAKWLAGKKPGSYSMADVLGLKS